MASRPNKVKVNTNFNLLIVSRLLKPGLFSFVLVLESALGD